MMAHDRQTTRSNQFRLAPVQSLRDLRPLPPYSSDIVNRPSLRLAADLPQRFSADGHHAQIAGALGDVYHHLAAVALQEQVDAAAADLQVSDGNVVHERRQQRMLEADF